MIENSNECKKIFAERLKKVREERGLTQKKFIEGLNINASTLSAYEQAKSNPSMEAIVEIALKYHLSVDWLIGVTDNPENKTTVEEQEKNKLETLADIGNVIAALVNTDIAENCADGINDIYGVNEHEIDIKLSTENIRNQSLYGQRVDNIITFRSHSEEFNLFFGNVHRLKYMLDKKTINKEEFDLLMTNNVNRLENITIKSLVNEPI